MTIKHIYITVIALMFASFSVSANAQYAACPVGQMQVGQNCGGGFCTAVCQNDPNYNSGGSGSSGGSSTSYDPGPPVPQVDSHAAVAWHPNASDVWAIQYGTNKQGGIKGAEKAALSACQKVMKTGCSIGGSVTNGVIAVGRGHSGMLFAVSRPATIPAVEGVNANCIKQAQRCSYPDIYYGYSRDAPDGKGADLTSLYDPYKKLGNSLFNVFGAVAIAQGSGAAGIGKMWFSGGNKSLEDAKSTAIAACQKATGAKCIDQKTNISGYILAVTDTKSVTFYDDRTLGGAEIYVKSHCKATKRKCTIQARFDVKQAGIQEFQLPPPPTRGK